MRTVITWTDDLISEEDLLEALTIKRLYDRALTSTCKIYKSGNVLMLTAPASYNRPWFWVQATGGDVSNIHQAPSDEEAVSDIGYEYMLDFEIKV